MKQHALRSASSDVRRSWIRGWRALFFVLCILVGISMGAGCAAEQPQETADLAVTAPANQATTLVLWYAWSTLEQAALVDLVDTYNQSHSDVQIVAQARPIASLGDELRTATHAGTGPHLVILQSHMLGQLAQEEVIIPLDDELFSPAERETLLSTALSSAQAVDAEGQTALYGVPFSFDTLVLYYHQGYLEAPPATFAELLETAHTLTDAGEAAPVWGLAYTLSLDKTIAYLPAFDGQIFDEEGAVIVGNGGRAGTERWLAWLLELRQDDKILAVVDSIAVDSALLSQEAVMTIDWAHALPTYRTLWGDNLGVAPLPRLDANAPPQPYVQSDIVSIVARATAPAEQQATREFMRYLISPAAQQALLAIDRQPTLLGLSDVTDAPETAPIQIFRTQAQQGQAMPNGHEHNTIVREELLRMQQAVLRGLASPTEAVDAADTALRERLETLGSQ